MKKWSLSRLPGYNEALPIDAVNASDLTEEIFRRKYVSKLRPCLIKGAASHWPAVQRWRSTDYLLEKIGATTEVRARTHPIIDGNPPPHIAKINAEHWEILKFGDFLRRCLSDKDDHFVLLSSIGRRLPSLAEDLSGFSFVKELSGSRLYPTHRTFMYRSGFSDWHYHPADEGLMVQVVGSKETMLSPPDEDAWRRSQRIIKDHGGRTFDDDCAYEFAGARLFRTIVEEGDALYIPVFWWHAVEGSPEGVGSADRVGITVASTFATSLSINYDLRFPAARLHLAGTLRSRYAGRGIMGTAGWLASLMAGKAPPRPDRVGL